METPIILPFKEKFPIHFNRLAGLNKSQMGNVLKLRPRIQAMSGFT